MSRGRAKKGSRQIGRSGETSTRSHDADTIVHSRRSTATRTTDASPPMTNLRRPRVTRHPYLDDGTRDADQRGRCTHCYLPETNERHTWPDVPAEQQAAEARRTGDR